MEPDRSQPVVSRVGTRGRVVLLLVSPVSVGAAMALAWLGLFSWGQGGHGRELVAAGLLAVVAGVFAALPAVMALDRGGTGLLTGSLAATVIRVVVGMLGVVLLLGPGWGLARDWLIGFVLAFYFVLLIGESWALAWVVRRAP